MPSTPYNRAGPGQPIPSYDDWTLQHRGTMAPWGVYERNGETASGFAWPAMVTEPVEAGKRFLSPGGGFENLPNQQSEQDALTLLMSLYGGNALSGTVKGAAATNALADMGRALSDTGRPNPLGSAIGSALDMSPEARLARAREQGFDTDTTWYHGTTGDFDAFNQNMFGSTTGADGAKKATFFSSEPDIAGAYVGLAPSRDYTDLIKLQEEALAKGNSAEFDRIEGVLESFQQEGVPLGGNIIPARLPSHLQPFDFYGLPWEDGAMVRAMDDARAAGFSGVNFKNIADHPYDRTKLSNVAAVFDPSNIRSVNAAFDPARAGENGLLLSDTGRPNAVGAALASSNENAVRSFHGTRYNVKGQFIPSDDGLLGPGVYSSVDPQKAGAHSGYNRGSIENPVMNYEHGKIFPFDVAQPVATEADWMRVLSDMEGAAPRVDQDRSVAVRAQQALANEGFGSVRYGDTVNTFAKGNITSPLTGETLFSDTRPSLLGSALASEQGKEDWINYLLRH